MVTIKRSLKWFLGMLLTINLLAAAVSAQDCETYDLHGAVTNEAGKAVRGALVEILDIQSRKPMKLDPSSKASPKIFSGIDGSYVFSILGLPDIEKGRDFILRVSQSGFIAHEEKINIYLCGFKSDVTMMKRGPVKRKTKTKR